MTLNFWQTFFLAIPVFWHFPTLYANRTRNISKLLLWSGSKLCRSYFFVFSTSQKIDFRDFFLNLAPEKPIATGNIYQPDRPIWPKLFPSGSETFLREIKKQLVSLRITIFFRYVKFSAPDSHVGPLQIVFKFLSVTWHIGKFNISDTFRCRTQTGPASLYCTWNFLLSASKRTHSRSSIRYIL